MYQSRLFLPIPPQNGQFQGMGYPVKIQKVERPTNKSYYVNFPVALAEALGIVKGEEFEWSVEDKNTVILTRRQVQPPRKLKSVRR